MDQKMSLFALHTHMAELGLLLVDAGYFVVGQPQMWEDVWDSVRNHRQNCSSPAGSRLSNCVGFKGDSAAFKHGARSSSPLWSGGKWQQLHPAFRSFPPRRPPADPRLLHSPFHVWKAIISLSFFFVNPPSASEKVNHLSVWCFSIVPFFI